MSKGDLLVVGGNGHYFFLVHKVFVSDHFIPEGVEGKADGVVGCMYHV